ncbi:PEP-CTERM sorting domain-containing protein [Pontiellaceae bacterium B12227]|nr:PEP-CTERM sorting domain-containing protein [Pontiellaceae bacterium B12227]
MKKWIIGLGLVAAMNVQAALVIGFSSTNEIPGTADAVTDSNFSDLLTDTTEASTYTIGTFSALPSGNPGSGVTFDIVGVSSQKFRAQNKGVGVAGGTGVNAIDNKADGSALEWLSLKITNVSGLGVGDQLVFTEMNVLFGSTSETYRLVAGASGAAPAVGDAYFTDNNDQTFTINSDEFTLGAGYVGDNKFIMGSVTVDVIPEPATLGLVAVTGGAVLFIRRRIVM